MYIVYGSPNCPSCSAAKLQLINKGFTFNYIDIYEDWVAQEMFREKGLRTVPQIFYDDIHIGGFNDLVEHLKGCK